MDKFLLGLGLGVLVVSSSYSVGILTSFESTCESLTRSWYILPLFALLIILTSFLYGRKKAKQEKSTNNIPSHIVLFYGQKERKKNG